MRASRILPILFLLLSLGTSAQQPPASADPQNPFQEALKKLEAGDHQGVVALLEPLKSNPNTPPPVLTMLGAAYIELGRFQEAQAVLDPAAAKETAGPPLLFNAGRAALALGQDEKGETYFKRAVEKAPQSLAARALGLRYGRQGKVLDAYKLLRPWAQAHPEDQEARLAAAFCAVELGRGSEADPLLEGLPDDLPQVRLLRARLLLARGEPRAAIASLAPLEADPPKEVERDLRWVLGEARMQIGEAAAAVALLEGHTASDPALALLLAQAHQQTGSPEKVLAILKPFLDPMPDPARVEPARRSVTAAMALEYGRALVAGARWAEAAAALETATALDPSNTPAWQVLGQALAGAGRRDDARKALAKFQELSQANPQRDPAKPPTDDPTGRAISEAARLASAGQAEQALALLRQEQQLAPNDLRTRMMEVRILLTQQRLDDALKAAEATLALAPQSADAVYQRGAVYLARKKTAEAERDFRQALALQPEHLAAMNDLAVLLIAQNRKDEARALLQKVLTLRPDDPVAKANLQSLGG